MKSTQLFKLQENKVQDAPLNQYILSPHLIEVFCREELKAASHFYISQRETTFTSACRLYQMKPYNYSRVSNTHGLFPRVAPVNIS